MDRFNSNCEIELGDIGQLERLRQADIQYPITMILYHDQLEEGFLQELQKTFEHYAGYPKWHLKLRWTEGADMDTLNWSSVITEALRADRIQTLRLADTTEEQLFERNFDRQLGEIFQNNVSSSNLENLKLRLFYLSESTLRLISKYLIDGFRILHLGLERCLFESFGTPNSMPGLALLAAGFTANTTLESILISTPNTLCFGRNGAMKDGEVAILLRGLISHPKLHSLELKGNNCGPETLEALHRIFAVASSMRTGRKQFKHLKLMECPEFDMDGFVKLLQPSNVACTPTTTTTITTSPVQSS